jgi:hypothetical protein
MAEQWPFKPLVEGSSPSTLTENGAFLSPIPAERQVLRLIPHFNYFFMEQTSK